MIARALEVLRGRSGGPEVLRGAIGSRYRRRLRARHPKMELLVRENGGKAPSKLRRETNAVWVRSEAGARRDKG